MLTEFSPNFIELHNRLARVQQKISGWPRSDRPERVPDFLIPTVAGMYEIIKDLAMPASLIAVVVLVKAIGPAALTDGISRNDLLTLFDHLNFAIRADLESRVLLSIDPSSISFYRQDEPLFGALVFQRFPSIEYDIQEAGKCLALGRSTACAFHSLRCLEAGILAISRCLSIADPVTGGERNWGTRISKIKAAYEAKWTNASRLHGDGHIFESFHAALAAMTNPWRNATMHLEKKYTEEEARHLFRIVEGFMKKIAIRMDENGLPLA
ncbi:hypothetical protein [Ferrovibrio sp.]|uniref:hypothetical protein n=1 Tax=Ferrovibrio sp. TaxID=1917215 RepID=UPI001B5B5446|nr:hypothetical protein [Ferrovibrio sp.]MBP7065434.1 hypothetical protein [Ferrovibrio sp.]